MIRTTLTPGLVLTLAWFFWPGSRPYGHAAEETFGPQVVLPLTGDGVTTAPLGQGGPGAVIEVQGTFYNGYDGKEYDALYTTDSSGRWGQPHRFLSWPAGLEPVNQAYNGSHTYRFRVQEGYDFTGQGITFRIAIDKFVDQYVIPPSEVRASLRPGPVPLSIRPVQLPLPVGAAPTPSLMSRLAWPVGLGLLLLVGAAAWRYHRVQQKHGLDADLRDLLRRIRQKHQRLLAVLNDREADYTGLRQRFLRLAEGAQTLAEHVQSFRRMERQFDRNDLTREIEGLDVRRVQAEDPAQRHELEAALAEKRKVLDLIEQTARNRDRYLARLSKVEATIDSTQLKVLNLQVASQDTFPEDPLIGAVDEELEILEETVEEVQRLWPEMDSETVQLRS